MAAAASNMPDGHGHAHWWQRVATEYAGSEDRPLGSYLGVLAAYSGLVGGITLVTRRFDRVRTPGVLDIVLAGVATHKLSRLVAKDPVTSPLRAPFTRYAGTSGEAELSEEVRGTGLQKAIGELVTCPFCMGQWIATGFAAGHILAPTLTRIAAALFTELAIADFLHFGYSIAEERQQQTG